MAKKTLKLKRDLAIFKEWLNRNIDMEKDFDLFKDTLPQKTRAKNKAPLDEKKVLSHDDYDADTTYLFINELRFMAKGLSKCKHPIGDEGFFLPCYDIFGDADILVMAKSLWYKSINCKDKSADTLLCAMWNHKYTCADFKQLFIEILQRKADELEKILADGKVIPELKRRLDETASMLNLNKLETEVLFLSFLNYKKWNNLAIVSSSWRRRSDLPNIVHAYSILTGEPHYNCARVLHENEALRRFGCIDSDGSINPVISDYLNGLSESKTLSSNFFHIYEGPCISLEMHGKLLERHISILKKLINYRKPGKPLNILLYGKPGTGKTSFAISLAANLGLKLQVINQQSTDKERERSNYSAHYRFSALQICNKTISGENNLILIDEADRLLDCGHRSIFSAGGNADDEKGMLNTVLDGLQNPCIWITNCDKGSMPLASRRRFDYSIFFDDLSNDQRAFIWKNMLSQRNLKSYFNDSKVLELATHYPVSAGGIDLALRSCELTVAGHSTSITAEAEAIVKDVLESHCELMGIKPVINSTSGQEYTLDGLNIKGNITANQLIDAARRFKAQSENIQDRRMTMLLDGPPGSGKTEFVKHIGRVLDTKVCVRLGSDILGMYVGETEKRIHEAFETAEKDGSILFLDEVDGLLRSRQMAKHSWEITQVNELLQCMESFKGILVCATNHSQSLDPATLRRFVFKLQFDYLDNTNKFLLFERYFSRLFQKPIDAKEKQKLNLIENLTPGDFRVVRDKLFQLDKETSTIEELMEMLNQESLSKEQGNKKRMGFSC